MDIPKGFREYPDGKNVPTVEHAYVKGVTGIGKAVTVIKVERLGGFLPRNEPLRKEQMPPNFTGELTTRNWRGVTVDGFVTSAEQDGLRMIVYAIQVPLKPEAIQLIVAGAELEREEISRLADTLLSSLEGETNW